MITGYPVIVVVVIAETDTFFGVKKFADDDIWAAFCMMVARNNKMKYLIAIYFSTFLHKLTVSSTAQSLYPVWG